MTTPVAKTAMERLADSYESHNEPTSEFVPSPRQLTAEERLAQSYDDAPRDRNARPEPHARPPLTAEERLARTYMEPGDTDGGAADADADADSEPRDDAADSPYTFRPHPNGRTIDPGVATALSDVARELKLDNAAAQQIVDKMSPVLDANMRQRIDSVVEGWAAETNADPTLGGNRLEESIHHAQQALDAFGTPGLRKLIGPVRSGGTGLGNHKELLRFLAAVGRKLGSIGTPPRGR